MITYGYVRVSSRDQNEDRQMAAMEQYGIPPEQIYLDKQSGKDFNRPQYKRLMRRLRAGDTLVIKSIDRLGRCYSEIIEQWRIISKEKHVALIVLDMPLLNTQQRDLTGTLIADLVLQLLSYVAQTEREMIRQRQAEGIAAARVRGVRFGAPPKPRPKEFPFLLEQWRRGLLSARAASRLLHVSHKTFLRWASQANIQGTKMPSPAKMQETVKTP